MLKLQIASLDVLERLIGGESEIELEIRQSVVDNFAKKHIKPLSEAAAKQMIVPLIQEAKESIKREFTGLQTYGFNLTEEYKSQIKRKVEEKAKEEVQLVIARAFNELVGFKDVVQTCKSQAEYIVKELTEKALEDRLNKMVDAKLKERLGLK